MEQKQETGWVNVGYGEFESFEEAQEDGKAIAQSFEIPWEEMRVRSVKEIPVEELEICSCGFPLVFSSEREKVYCQRCEEFLDREDGES